MRERRPAADPRRVLGADEVLDVLGVLRGAGVRGLGGGRLADRRDMAVLREALGIATHF